MNWTCLVYGGPMLAIIIWWIMDARKWFKGPKVNMEHRMYGEAEDDSATTDKKPPSEEKES